MDISSLTSAHMHTDDEEGDDLRDDEDHSHLEGVAAAASAKQSASVEMSQEPEQEHDQDSDDDSDMSGHYQHEHEQQHIHNHAEHAYNHNHSHSHPHRSLSPPRRSPSPIIALSTRRATMPRLAKTRASALASTSMHNGIGNNDDRLATDSSSAAALHLNGAGSEKGGDMINGHGSESDHDDDATPDKSAKSASRVNGSTKGKGQAGNVPANRSKVAIRAAKPRAASKARIHQQAASDAALTQDVHHHRGDNDVNDEDQEAEQNNSASTSLSGIASEVPAIHRHPDPLRGDPIPIKPKKKRLPSKIPRKSTAGAPREHTCEHCTKAFARKSDLIRHIRTHMGDKPFACACGKAFIQASALRVHERTHTGEKPYQCPHCTKCFADSSSLVRHKRVHTGERPYLCPMPGCDRSFCRNVTLLKHQLREHGVEAMKQDGKPYLSLMEATRPKRSHEEMAGEGDDEGNGQKERENGAHAIEPKIEVADDGLLVEEGSNAWYDDDSRGSYYAGGDDDADDADYGRTRRAPKKKARKAAAAKKRGATKKSRVSGVSTLREPAAARRAAHPFSAATSAGGAEEGGSYPGSHAHSPAMVLDPYAYAAHPAYDGRFYYPHPARHLGVPTMAGHPYAYAYAHAHAMQAAYTWGAVPGVAPPVTRNGTPASMTSHRSRASFVDPTQAQQAAASGYPYDAAAISPGMTIGHNASASAGGAAYGSHSAAASDVHMASAANSDAGGQTEAEMHYYARSQRPAGLHLQIPFSATSPAAAGALIKPARSADPLKPSQSAQPPGSPDSVRSCVSAPEAAMVAAAVAGHAQEKRQSSSKASDSHSTKADSAGETLKAPAPAYDGQHQKQQLSFLAQAQQNHQHYRAVPAPLQVHPHAHAYAGQMSVQTPTVATPATYGSAHSPMAPLSAGQPGYAHPSVPHYASPHASSAAHYHYYGYAYPHTQQQQATHHAHYPHYAYMQHQEHLPTPGSAATSFFSGAQSIDHRSSIASTSLISPYQQPQVSATAGAHVQPYDQQHQTYMQHYAPTQQYHAQTGQMYYPPTAAAEAHAKQLQEAAAEAVATSATEAVGGQQYYHYPVPAVLAQEAQSQSAQSYGSQEHPLMNAQASQQSMQATYGKDHEQALLPAFDQQQQSSASLSEEARSNSQAGKSDHLTRNYTAEAIGERSDGGMQFDPPFSASSHESAFPESDFLLAASRKASLASVHNASPFEPIFPMESTLGQTLVAGEDGL